MLNFHQHIIDNNLNNSIMEELAEKWLGHLMPEARSGLIHGFYNAGILVINMSDFNRDNFYDLVIKKNFHNCCKELYTDLKPTIEKCMRRMFKGFNQNLMDYEVVLFMEGNDEDNLEPEKYTIKIF